ncbi:lysozyme [Brevibacillus halotolerans]|uniref:lysozyme n=1 Tax=Brevibacillus TaxID=55080 RepID=UPI00215B8953|nr:MULTISPECIES: lysozyme [Brevibacillus]MCR8964136.1 lysozyme [Brevibacillus laterosporus]MCZ0836291.1 lysozyme [Brevibacillus halotolerans]
MAGNFSLGTDGANLIKKHEGLSLKFYGDPYGYPTVGWGHLITLTKTYTKNTTGNPNDSLLSQAEADALSKSLNLGYTSPISQSQANTFFANDTASAVAAVNKLVLPKGHKFSQSQFDALVSLTFNAGPGVLATNDVKAMLANAHIYPTFVGPLLQSQIDTCSKLVSKAFSYDRNLQKRRNEEATLFCKGMMYTHKYPVYTL